jgi:hypothetical protein
MMAKPSRNDTTPTDQIGLRRVGRAIYLRMGQQHQIATEDGFVERQCRGRFAPEIDVCNGLDAHRLRPLSPSGYVKGMKPV